MKFLKNNLKMCILTYPVNKKAVKLFMKIMNIYEKQGWSYLPELFRKITPYLLKLIRKITPYLLELFRKMTPYLLELFQQITSYLPETLSRPKEK